MEAPATYCVYLVTNLVNGKQYAGQTCNLKERWAAHKRAARSGADLCLSRALRKYGESNFAITVIRESLSKKEADLEEMLAIRTLRLLDSEFGYNMTEGGAGAGVPGEEARRKMSENSAGWRNDVTSEDVVRLYKEGRSTREIAETFDVLHATVRRRLLDAGVSLRSISESKRVKWNLNLDDGAILALYRSGKLIIHVAEELGVWPSTIRRRLIALKEPTRSISEAFKISRVQRAKQES